MPVFAKPDQPPSFTKHLLLAMGALAVFTWVIGGLYFRQVERERRTSTSSQTTALLPR